MVHGATMHGSLHYNTRQSFDIRLWWKSHRPVCGVRGSPYPPWKMAQGVKQPKQLHRGVGTLTSVLPTANCGVVRDPSSPSNSHKHNLPPTLFLTWECPVLLLHWIFVDPMRVQGFVGHIKNMFAYSSHDELKAMNRSATVSTLLSGNLTLHHHFAFAGWSFTTEARIGQPYRNINSTNALIFTALTDLFDRCQQLSRRFVLFHFFLHLCHAVHLSSSVCTVCVELAGTSEWQRRRIKWRLVTRRWKANSRAVAVSRIINLENGVSLQRGAARPFGEGVNSAISSHIIRDKTRIHTSYRGCVCTCVREQRS